jgi:dihydroorotate dehydrogenase
VIATNTTQARRQVHVLPNGRETGGLSGAPLPAVRTRAVHRVPA